MDGTKDNKVRALLAAALEGTLTKQQVDRLAAIDRDLLKLVLIAGTSRSKSWWLMSSDG